MACTYDAGMEFRQMRYFIAVAEAGSFTAAAAALHMSQPPLSLAIAQLEKELGVRLFERSAKGVRATSAGAYLLESSYRILDEVSIATEYLKGYSGGSLGRVSIAAVPALMWKRVPLFLRLITREYPNMDLRLVDPPPLQTVQMVLERTVDLGFIVTANNQGLADQYQGALRLVPCGVVNPYAVFPADEALSLPDPVDLSIMEGRTLLALRRTLSVRSLPEVLEEGFARYGVRPARTRIVETVQTCLPLVAAGLGVAVLTQASDLDDRSLGVRRLSQPLAQLEAAAIWRADREVSPALQLILDLVQADGFSLLDLMDEREKRAEI